MASATESASGTPIFDQLCAAITHEQGVTDASLKTAQILMWDVGPNSLVGLEADANRVIYHCSGGGEFVAAIPFDETGVHGDEAELLGRGEDIQEGLETVKYEWVHPEFSDFNLQTAVVRN